MPPEREGQPSTVGSARRVAATAILVGVSYYVGANIGFILGGDAG